MTYEKQLQAMIDDPSVHNWVKVIAKRLQEHDPVDVLHDCELLVAMCKARLGEREATKGKEQRGIWKKVDCYCDQEILSPHDH